MRTKVEVLCERVFLLLPLLLLRRSFRLSFPPPSSRISCTSSSSLFRAFVILLPELCTREREREKWGEERRKRRNRVAGRVGIYGAK